MMPVQGVDVSTFDGTIDWTAVRKAGIEFAYIKATEALQQDARHVARTAYFQSNWHKTQNEGLLRGAYHFFRDNLDSELQAETFVRAIQDAGGMNDTDLPPMLDVETSDGADSHARILRVHRCLVKIKEILGVRPLIYTYRSFWDDNMDDSFGAYSLWLADYGDDKPVGPSVPDRPAPAPPEGFTDFVIGQYAEFGSVAGINAGVDLSLFRGSRDELVQFSTQSRV